MVIFQKYKVHESFPNLDVKFPALPQEGRIKVYTDIDQISQNLTDERFQFVEDTESADILWTREYLKDCKYQVSKNAVVLNNIVLCHFLQIVPSLVAAVICNKPNRVSMRTKNA